MIRTYSELIALPTFEERFRYLKLDGLVAAKTFGFDRWLNQVFYRSKEWKYVHDYVITRDNGCDLACPDRAIPGRIIVHHMNPATIEGIMNRDEDLLNPEFLISSALLTHNAIHYSDESILITNFTERSPNDTCPWK